MLVEKAIGTVPHSGGKLFGKESRHWKTLVDWLKDGANEDPKDIAKPTNIELFPPSALLEGKVYPTNDGFAHYSDGTTRDVTLLRFSNQVMMYQQLLMRKDCHGRTTEKLS